MKYIKKYTVLLGLSIMTLECASAMPSAAQRFRAFSQRMVAQGNVAVSDFDRSQQARFALRSIVASARTALSIERRLENGRIRPADRAAARNRARRLTRLARAQSISLLYRTPPATGQGPTRPAQLNIVRGSNRLARNVFTPGNRQQRAARFVQPFAFEEIDPAVRSGFAQFLVDTKVTPSGGNATAAEIDAHLLRQIRVGRQLRRFNANLPDAIQ